jgi:alkylation response protein AidB-like acyl-CoA dehydrogenase
MESRHCGITAFVVDMRSDGVDVGPLKTMTGSSEFSEVYLDALEVPDESRIGEVNGGWTVALSVLNAERGPYAIRRAALIERSLILALKQAAGSKTSPVPRQEVVRAYLSCCLLEHRIDTLVNQLSNGVTIGPESALTKLLMTNAEQQVSALRGVLDGAHLMAEGDYSQSTVAEEFLYSRAASIYGGSSEIQRNVIGERLLGLQRE